MPGKTDQTPAPEAVAVSDRGIGDVIAQMQKHRASHQSWLDHFRVDPDGQCGKCTPEVLAGVGNAKDQEDAIRDYDWMLEALTREAAQAARLREENADLKRVIDTTRADRAAAEAERDALREEKQNRDDALRSALDQLAAAAREVTAWKGRVRDVIGEVSAAEAERDALRKELDERHQWVANDSLADLKRRRHLAEAEQRIARQAVTIRHQQEAWEQMRAERDALRGRLVEARDHIDGLTRDIAELPADVRGDLDGADVMRSLKVLRALLTGGAQGGE